MELKQEAQTFEMPHLLTYYECDETEKYGVKARSTNIRNATLTNIL